jgi:uncharacterized protein (TIGR03435 family)
VQTKDIAEVYQSNFTSVVDTDGAVQSAADPGDGPSLLNALEKQLGLKLVKTRNVPVDIIVIDHADKVPTEN